jgi:hypothetical protein
MDSAQAQEGLAAQAQEVAGPTQNVTRFVRFNRRADLLKPLLGPDVLVLGPDVRPRGRPAQTAKKIDGRRTRPYICICKIPGPPTHHPTFFPLGFFFSAFLGVSRQGSSKTREKKLSAFQKKLTGEIFFRGRIFFWGIFYTSFPFDFLLRWLSASR